ncbi:MAG: hypothetical protein ACJAUP_000508 [Cellvibrionaceae bacterium]|jgi:hypothetical protein
MIICGVDLTANDAVICIVKLDAQLFSIIDCRVRKLSLSKKYMREDFVQFQSLFAQLMKDYQVDKVVIKERMPKGKFAGGAVSFKLESAIQLIKDLDVTLITPAQIKATLADNPFPISYADTGLKGFQETAFTVAFVAHNLT